MSFAAASVSFLMVDSAGQIGAYAPKILSLDICADIATAVDALKSRTIAELTNIYGDAFLGLITVAQLPEQPINKYALTEDANQLTLWYIREQVVPGWIINGTTIEFQNLGYVTIIEITGGEIEKRMAAEADARSMFSRMTCLTAENEQLRAALIDTETLLEESKCAVRASMDEVARLELDIAAVRCARQGTPKCDEGGKDEQVSFNGFADYITDIKNFDRGTLRPIRPMKE